MENLSLKEVLELRFPKLAQSKVKLVRHADSRGTYDFKSIKKDKSKLLQYQSEQSKEVFKDCDYIISFLGLNGTLSLLLGIYKVNGVKEVNHSDHNFLYDLEEVQIPEIKEAYYDRIIIDWGKGTVSWHQRYDQEKPIIEILPKGYMGDFPGYLEFSLDYFELRRLNENQSANQVWINKLSSVNGIYLILDNLTGNQYVGSAYGTEGIWGRWKTYANTKTGGNIKLEELLAKDPNYAENFTYSILQTLPSNLMKEEIFRYESLYKEKLGTRAHGLNRN